MPPRLLARLQNSVLELTERPLFNFASLLITLASILSLSLPAIQNLSLREEAWMQRADKILLATIAIESLLRLLSSRRKAYLFSFAFSIDLLSVFPLVFLYAREFGESLASPTLSLLGAPLEWPGFLLFEGIRSLRLLPILYYFHRSMQLSSGRQGRISPIKERIFSGIASLAFAIILGAGLAISIYTHRNNQEKRKLRQEQIILQAQSYGILQARLVFEPYILGSWITEHGKRTWISGTAQSPEEIRRYYKTGRDYVQIDEILPGQSIAISFQDLRREQSRIELTVLLIGILVIFALIARLNSYLDRYILEPLEKARRTIHLRLYEEEIESTNIPREPYTEVTRLINDIDRLYQRMRAPAKKLIEDTRQKSVSN